MQILRAQEINPQIQPAFVSYNQAVENSPGKPVHGPNNPLVGPSQVQQSKPKGHPVDKQTTNGLTTACIKKGVDRDKSKEDFQEPNSDSNFQIQMEPFFKANIRKKGIPQKSSVCHSFETHFLVICICPSCRCPPPPRLNSWRPSVSNRRENDGTFEKLLALPASTHSHT